MSITQGEICMMYCETEQRWYDIAIGCDLFGIVVLQRWGSRHSRHRGMRSTPVASSEDAIRLLEKLINQRKAHGYQAKDAAPPIPCYESAIKTAAIQPR